MKVSKSLIVGTAVALTMSSFTLSALTPNELADVIRSTRACPAAPKLENEPVVEQGWFSSFRAVTGNFFRAAGDSIRTEGDSSSAGKVKELVKDGLFSAVSSKIGYSLESIKDTICHSIGNGLRTIGQFIKGGEATQTTTRVILDNLHLNKQVNKNSRDHQVESALKTVAQAIVKVDQKIANEEYNMVIEGLIKRGYATKAQIQAIDTNKIYVNALSEAVFRERNSLTCSGFTAAVKLKGFEALENIRSVKEASLPGEKQQAMNQYLKETYDRIKLHQEVNNNIN